MRKQHSIKTRVTVWYVSFLVLIVIILFGALGYTGHTMMQDDIKGDLKHTVASSLHDVEIADGELHIDDDLIRTENSISVLVYTENNFIVTGSLPEGVNNEIPFIDGEIRLIEDGSNKFFVYDRLVSDPDYRDVWVRGITSANMADLDPAIDFMSKAFLVILPLLILIASIGGWRITRRAFRPVGQIADTASAIEAGGDLSKRIGLKAEEGSKDEIYQLSTTFDNMLERLESSFEAEKQFSNDASHELRTPLSVIMAQCEYAIENASTIEEARTSLDIIYGQSRRMSSLISKLLMIARADRGTLKPDFETVDVSELTQMVAESHEAMAEQRSITISCSIGPHIMAQADESMLIRVWDNLISNSIKYGREGGRIDISLVNKDGHFTGVIADDGIGISAEDLPKIWNRFYQADPSRSDGSGAGLGLSMVKWIVTEHGGSISAESEKGKGTRITFTMPLKQE